MLDQITDSLTKAFAAEGAGVLVQVQPCAKPDLADFECKGAFLAARQLNDDPLKLAERVVARMPDIAEFSVAGKGLINIKLTPKSVEQLVNEPLRMASRSGRIVLDFGGPNVAKPMHVGHLRSLVIGDSLQRLLRFVGYDVISDIHFGDWGLQMGLLIAALRDQNPNDITIEMLEAAYPAASARAKEDEAFRKDAQTETERLQNGDGASALWKRFMKLSMTTVNRELQALNVVFTLLKGESDVQNLIPSMLSQFEDMGLAVTDEGALIAPVCDPPLILRNSSGAALYATTDLATIVSRVHEFNPEKIIYVVDQRQALHFQQVFAVAATAGIISKDKLAHVGFGTVNGTDGKPLKTREGGVPKLHDLITSAIEKAAERNPEASVTVGIGALKFADLQNQRLSSYVFDPARFLSFEGKTGPYLMYQCVRVKSILKNAVEPGPIVVTDEAERTIALKLVYGFKAAVDRAVDTLSPKEIVDHAYDLAQTFSKFYTTHHIAENPSRVALAMKVQEQLETCLELLGVKVPEKM